MKEGWAGFMKKILSISGLAFCLSSFSSHKTFATDAADLKSGAVTISDIKSILTYADAELSTASTFARGLDDLGLVLAQHEVINALKTNNKVASEVRQLKLPGTIANLLKKAYKATRTSTGAGAQYKAEVAQMLVAVYAIWSDEDLLQKLNFERWSDELFDELDRGRARDGKQQESTKKKNGTLAQVAKLAAETTDVELCCPLDDSEFAFGLDTRRPKQAKAQRNVVRAAVIKKRFMEGTSSRKPAAAHNDTYSAVGKKVRKSPAQKILRPAVNSASTQAARASERRKVGGRPVVPWQNTTKATAVESADAPKPRRRRADKATADSGPHQLKRPTATAKTDSSERKPRAAKSSEASKMARQTAKPVVISTSSANGAVRSK